MSKMEEVRSQMMQAMKNGDKPRKECLSLLLSALKAYNIFVMVICGKNGFERKLFL